MGGTASVHVKINNNAQYYYYDGPSNLTVNGETKSLSASYPLDRDGYTLNIQLNYDHIAGTYIDNTANVISDSDAQISSYCGFINYTGVQPTFNVPDRVNFDVNCPKVDSGNDGGNGQNIPFFQS